MATTTLPPVHQYEEDSSRGHAIGGWLKAQYALYILVALLLVATSTKGSIFWGGTNLTNLLLQMSIIGVVVLAELIVVLTGGIDISVGSTLGLAAVVSAGLFGGPSVLLALLVVLQRFAYRQVMYAVVVRAFVAALRGRAHGWGKLERTASVLGTFPAAERRAGGHPA